MKVLMLGEGLARRGGIVSVQQLILEQTDPSVEIEHIATLVDGSPLDKIRAFLKALLNLSRELLFGSVDLVHIHVSERGSAFRQAITTLISKLFGKPVVMHTHGSEFHEFYSHLPAFVKVALSWVYRKCDRFIVLSESWKEFYIDALELRQERVTVLPNAVKIPDQIPQREPTESSQILFVFFGRIGHRKGAFDLVKALSLLPREYHSQVRLVMAGDGELERLEELVQDFELQDVVSIMSWISPAQREALSREASVFILPSYNEGLPMALLEAMSWGLAVITTPVGGIPSVIQHKRNGLLVDPGDVYQIADSIKLLIDDCNLRHELGRAAYTSVLPFGSNKYWQSLTHVYTSTLFES